MLWDMPIYTDRKITANRPDIVIKDHKTKTCKLIDMAVPSDRKTSVKVTDGVGGGDVGGGDGNLR